MRDLVYGWRRLRKSPVFTLTAVVSLGLGIGAAATMFSAFRSVFLRPLPYRDADRVVQIEKHDLRGGTTGVTLTDLEFLRRNARSFEAAAWFSYFQVVALSGTGEPANLWVRSVSRELFPLLESKPLLGRTFASPTLSRMRRPPLFCLMTPGGKISMATRKSSAGKSC